MIRQRIKRWLHVRRMMRCIELARRSVYCGGYDASKTDGLRVIKRFERVNRCAFNPRNSTHVNTITGWGAFESYYRALRLKKVIQ